LHGTAHANEAAQFGHSHLTNVVRTLLAAGYDDTNDILPIYSRQNDIEEAKRLRTDIDADAVDNFKLRRIGILNAYGRAVVVHPNKYLPAAGVIQERYDGAFETVV